jgi:hypothetical protein
VDVGSETGQRHTLLGVQVYALETIHHNKKANKPPGTARRSLQGRLVGSITVVYVANWLRGVNYAEKKRGSGLVNSNWSKKSIDFGRTRNTLK